MNSLRKIKKGFTLVELVVVIAIVGILAGVGVAIYNGVTKNAKESADSEILSQLNTQLKAKGVTKHNETAYEAYLDAYEIGFDLKKMTPSAGDFFVWDQEHDLFGIGKGSGSSFEITAKDNSADFTKVNAKQWLFVKEIGENVNKSWFATGEIYSNLDIKAGFDAGEAVVGPTINYAGEEEAQVVVIRTDDENVVLNITAFDNGTTCDTISHFGQCGIIYVNKAGSHSFHEFGTAGYMEIKEGNVVIEESASVDAAWVDETNASKVTVEIKGEVEHAHAGSIAAANTLNGTGEKIWDCDAEGQQGQRHGATGKHKDDDPITTKDNVKDEVAPEAFSGEVKEKAEKEGKKYVARIGSTGYETLGSALIANEETTTAVLLEDINLDAGYTSVENFKGTFDGAGHSINTNKVANSVRNIVDTINGTASFKNVDILEGGHLVTMATGGNDKQKKNNFKSITFDNVNYYSLTKGMVYMVEHNDSLYTNFNLDATTSTWMGDITIKNCYVCLDLKGSTTGASAVFVGGWVQNENNSHIVIEDCTYEGTFVGRNLALVLGNGQKIGAWREDFIKITGLVNKGSLIGSGDVYAVGGIGHNHQGTAPQYYALFDKVELEAGGTFTKMNSDKFLTINYTYGNQTIGFSGKTILDENASKVRVEYSSRVKTYKKADLSKEIANTYSYSVAFEFTYKSSMTFKYYTLVDYNSALSKGLITQSTSLNWASVMDKPSDQYAEFVKDSKNYLIVKFDNASDEISKFDYETGVDPDIAISVLDAEDRLIVSTKKDRLSHDNPIPSFK